MTELSNDARAMLLGCFLNPRASLTMHNVQNRLTARAQAGIDELIAAGLVQVDRPHDEVAVYTLTDAGADADRREIARGDLFGFMEQNGRFSIAEPIAQVTA
jgi:hypothetical protein